jgi:phosphoenolpyruvate carboxykinase (ATP)
MKLSYTRAMITAALNGSLNKVGFEAHSVFGYMMPSACPNVPAELLNPRNTWADKSAYDAQANKLANMFVSNFEQFASGVDAEILASAPKATQKA